MQNPRTKKEKKQYPETTIIFECLDILRSHAGTFFVCIFVDFSNEILYKLFFSAEAILFPVYILEACEHA